MNRIIALIAGILIPVVAWSQGVNTSYLDHRLRDYLFESGSFWVYERADSTEMVDSLVETNLVHEFTSAVYMHGELVIGPVEYYKAFYESKTHNYQTWDQYIGYVIVKEGVDWGNNGQYIFLSSYEPGDQSSGAEIIDTIPTYNVNNFEFQHVTRMLIMNNKFQNNNPTCYYYAKGVGIIRKEYFSADTSHLTEVWNIKNWYIAKTSTSIPEQGSQPTILAIPNPTTSTLHVTVAPEDINGELHIYDYMGRRVYTSRIMMKEFDMDISNFKSGSYFLVIENKYTRKKLKIIKN
jgi:hypothetical protein